ncbi:hypothetical protein SUGI_1170920 [Cryptomeria japonica]|nr:hypothetical protein SUGI_1170920 [Cryptomeria japonica]
MFWKQSSFLAAECENSEVSPERVGLPGFLLISLSISSRYAISQTIKQISTRGIVTIAGNSCYATLVSIAI